MLPSLFLAVRALALRYAEWREHRRAFAELSALDDRSLADIGISRSEIPYVLSHAEFEHVAETAPVAANRNFQHAA